MRTIGASLLTALAQENTYLARIWKITLSGGTTSLYYTDCPQVITFGGNQYLPDPGMQVSAIKQTAGGGTQNAEIDIYFGVSALKEADVRSGLLDSAKFELNIVDYTNPDGLGAIKLMTGKVADIAFNDKGQCTLTITGNLNSTGPDTAEYYSKTCRARLGDARCTKSLTTWTVAATVTAVSATSLMTFDAAAMIGVQPDNFYALGVVTWLTGANAGRKDEIATQTQSNGRIVLSVAPAFPIVVGDTCSIVPGCDKQVTTCKNKFNNLVNFRGEAYAPPPGLSPISVFKNPADSSTFHYDGRHY